MTDMAEVERLLEDGTITKAQMDAIGAAVIDAAGKVGRGLPSVAVAMAVTGAAAALCCATSLTPQMALTIFLTALQDIHGEEDQA